MNFVEQFLSKSRNLYIYIAVKLIIILLCIFYIFTNDDFVIQVIFTGTAFFLASSMIPVIILFNFEKKKRDNADN